MKPLIWYMSAAVVVSPVGVIMRYSFANASTSSSGECSTSFLYLTFERFHIVDGISALSFLTSPIFLRECWRCLCFPAALKGALRGGTGSRRTSTSRSWPSWSSPTSTTWTTSTSSRTNAPSSKRRWSRSGRSRSRVSVLSVTLLEVYSPWRHRE